MSGQRFLAVKTSCPFAYNEKNRPKYSELCYVIADLCENLLLNKNITNFITGGAQGVDQLAFWAVEHLKQKYPDKNIQNILCIPFENFHSKWSKTGLFSQNEFNKILKHADQVKIISPTNEIKAYQKRNEYMVNHSCTVIAVAKWLTPDQPLPSPGGTSNTMQYAKSRNKPIIWLHPITHEIRHV